jgi:hypothetical protein
MLKDQPVFTDIADMSAHYRAVKENLRKNVYVPKPMSEVQDSPVRKKLLVSDDRRTRLVVPEKYLDEYKQSIKGLKESGKITKLTMREIVKEVAEKHRLKENDLMTPSRRKNIIAARHEAFYRMRHELKMAFPRIAAYFMMDHTTVIHGVRKHEELSKKGN